MDRHSNLLLFQVLKYLNSKHDNSAKLDEIKSYLNIDEIEMKQLLQLLRNNARIEIFDDFLRFRPILQFSTKEDLVKFLASNFPDGIKYEDIRNESVFKEVLNMNSSEIVTIEVKSNSHMLYYNDLTIQSVDDNLKELWHLFSVPEKSHVFN